MDPSLLTRPELKKLLLLLEWDGTPRGTSARVYEVILEKLASLMNRGDPHPTQEWGKKIERVRRLLREQIVTLCVQYDYPPHFALLHRVYVECRDIEDVEGDSDLALSRGSILDYLTRARFELLLVINAQLGQQDWVSTEWHRPESS